MLFEEALIMSVIDLNLLSSNDRRFGLSIGSLAAPVVQTEEGMSNDDHRIRMLQDAIDKEPLNYWLWHNLCGLYCTMDNLDGAIHACELGIQKSRADPSPLMELTNLYAAKGDYKAATTTGERLLNVKPVILLLALEDSRHPLVTSTSLKNEQKIFLSDR